MTLPRRPFIHVSCLLYKAAFQTVSICDRKAWSYRITWLLSNFIYFNYFTLVMPSATVPYNALIIIIIIINSLIQKPNSQTQRSAQKEMNQAIKIWQITVQLSCLTMSCRLKRSSLKNIARFAKLHQHVYSTTAISACSGARIRM